MLTDLQVSNFKRVLKGIDADGWANYMILKFQANNLTGGIKGEKEIEKFKEENPLDLTLYGYFSTFGMIFVHRDRSGDWHGLEDGEAYAVDVMTESFGEDFVDKWYYHNDKGGMGPDAILANMTYNETSPTDKNLWLLDYMHDFYLYILDVLHTDTRDKLLAKIKLITEMHDEMSSYAYDKTRSVAYYCYSEMYTKSYL